MQSVFSETSPLDTRGLWESSRRLTEAYPLFSAVTIGHSALGRPLFLFRMGKGEPETLYVGGVHAMEYLTSMLLVRFCGRLCGTGRKSENINGLDAASYLETHGLDVLPMLNPDGVELHLHGAESAGRAAETVRRLSGGDFSHWQANARGVDLNHNFDAGFPLLQKKERAEGILGPGPAKFGGYAPESEPETRALCDLCRKTPYHSVFAFHSQGEEIYWQYGPHTPPGSAKLAEKLAESIGYTVGTPTGTAVHGGFKDWFIENFRRPGFTIEIGKGRNPLPVDSFPDLYRRVEPLLLLGLRLR